MRKVFLLIVTALFLQPQVWAENLELSSIKNGVVLFTFDDCDISGWTNAIPLFKSYNAHATFFFSGKIGKEQIECIKKLKAAGHSFGLHGEHHVNAPEYIKKHGENTYLKFDIYPQLLALEKAGLTTKNFAFPNNRHNTDTVKLLQKHFYKFRAGAGASLMNPQENAYEKAFFSVSDLSDKVVFGGFGVGMYYKTSKENFLLALEKASHENKVIVIFSHAIKPNAKGVHMPLDYLEAALKKARELDMKIIGFDDIPDNNR